MLQLSLLDPPRARRSDPATSQVAAAEVARELPILKARLVAVVRELGSCTASEAAAICCSRWPDASAETYRKRAGECVRMGLLTACEANVCGVSGKLATVYVVP